MTRSYTRRTLLAVVSTAALTACGMPSIQSDPGSKLVLNTEIRGQTMRVKVKAEIAVPRPAMLSLQPLPPTGRMALIISSFGVFGKVDGVRAIRDVGNALSSGGASPEVLAQDIVWPNEALVVPEAIGGGPVLVVAGGFLVPGKTGAITLVSLPGGRKPAGTRHVVAQGPQGWFYHRTVVRDLDGDGRMDILTARAQKPMMGAAQGQLVWYEQPDADPLGRPWTEHVMATGPDVHFHPADLDGDGREEILAAQFFSRKLSLFWPAGASYAGRVVDDSLGAAFDVTTADLDGDGRPEVLATNHESDRKAGVFAYDIPADPRSGTWTRRTLLSGIETRQQGINQASPGQALAFHPGRDWPGKKPAILVAGDASQRAHLLVPGSQAAGDWAYREEIVLDAKATVGTCAAGDVDGDGTAEVFVPAYDRDRIFVLEVAPRK
ncbi:MAG: VCBS repeat-containing protein [Candidatus Sericytochromatia bacterium]|uniref:VCBS repeat-containing protein n=1 Tax=Candidatus Tanganyikabacteria bacterium TaxID=2961651 RepID=A0A937X5Y4_9BACT|nr:VCBS repeat-containing protein [Candidatus Tanganyikabacteria bacterium]